MTFKACLKQTVIFFALMMPFTAIGQARSSETNRKVIDHEAPSNAAPFIL